MSNYQFRGLTLPEDLQRSLDLYANSGVPLGDFLRSCVENSLNRAVSYADERNMPLIPVISSYLYNECPGTCWGSPRQYIEWLSKFATIRGGKDRECR